MASNLKINIDVLLNGAKEIQKLSQALAQLTNAANKTNAGQRSQTTAAQRAENALIAQAQASARLQKAQGNLAGAIQTVQKALQGVNQQSAAAQRAFIQLAGLQAALARQTQGAFRRVAGQVRESGESIQATGFAILALTAGIVDLGKRAASSAINIDRQVNTLKALTGSADAAEKRYAELVATAQKTPGLTANLASILDAQLRVAGATEATINRILPAIGRLNAISPLADPQRFAQNLVQLVTQNFEKIDLKELVGQSPFAGNLIKQIFQVDSPIDAQAIRESAERLGLTTVDAFFDAFAKAAASNPRLANVTESLGTQFDKLADRIAVALRPLGVSIINAIIPIVDAIVPAIERISKAFNALPPVFKQIILVAGALTAALGPLLIIFGGFTQTIASIITLTSAFGGLAVAGTTLAAGLGVIGPVLLGLSAILAAGAIIWANYASVAEKAAKVTGDSLKTQLSEIDKLKNLEQQAAGVTNEHAKLSDVISQLDPDTRAYISTIQDEKLAAQELNRVLAEQRQLREAGLGRDLGALAAASEQVQSQLAGVTNQLKNLKKLSDEFARAGGKSPITVALGDSEESLPRSAQEFGDAIRNLESESKKLTDSQIALGRAISVVVTANGKGIDGFVALQRALGLSEDQIQSLVTAYNSFRSQQGAAANSTADTTRVIDSQTRALRDLKNALSDLNLQELKAGIDKQIEGIAQEASKAADPIAEAKRLFKEARQKIFVDPARGELTRPLDDSIKKLQDMTRIVDELNKQVSPSQGRQASNFAREKTQTIKETEQLEAARFAVQKALAEQSIEFAKQSQQEETHNLERALEQRQISIAEFYDRKRAIDQGVTDQIKQSIQDEIDFENRRLQLVAENAQKRLALAKTKDDKDQVSLDAEEKRQQIIATIISLETKLGVIQRENAAAQKKSLQEQAQLVNDLRVAIEKIPGSLSKSAGKGLSDAVNAVREAQFDLLRNQQAVLDANLAASIQNVQNLVDAGLLSEIDARQTILELERSKKKALEDNLKLQLAILQAQLSAPGLKAGERGGIEAQIAGLQAALARLQQLGIDPLIANVRQGLERDLTGAFSSFLENAGQGIEALRTLALNVINSFRRALSEIIVKKIEEKIINPLVGKFIDFIFGQQGATQSVAITANTVATSANTAALTANTAALIGKSITGQIGNFQINAPQDILQSAAQKQKGQSFTDKIGDFFTKAFDKVKNVFSKFADFIGDVGSKIGSVFAKIGEAVFSAVKFIASAIGGLFAEGGYTGDGDKRQPAGIVHKKEFVEPAHVVQRWGPGFFEAIRQGTITPANLAQYVNSLGSSFLASTFARTPRYGFASGGLVGTVAEPPGGVSSAGSVRDLVINNLIDANQILDVIASPDGANVIFNHISSQPLRTRTAFGGGR